MKSLRLFWLWALLLAALPGVAQQAPAQVAWLRAAYNPTITARADSYIMGLSATDATGNTYAWVGYRHSFTLDDSLFTAPDTLARIGLLKLDPAGHLAWFRALGTDSARIQAYSLTTDAAGDVVVAGRIFRRKVWLDGQLLDARNDNVSFVAKWSAAGAPIFARIMGRGSDQYPMHVRTDTAGNVYVVGAYHAYIDFGPVRLDQANYNGGNGNSTLSTYCAKFSPQGVTQWAHTLNDTDSLSLSLPAGMGIDQAGNIYLFGMYCAGSGIGGFTFPPTVTPPGQDRVPRQFWAKISAAGAVVGARTFDSPATESRGGDMDFAVNPTTGFGYGTITLAAPTTLAPGLTVQPTGGNDALLFCLDANGVFQWTRQVGGSQAHDDVFSYDLALDGNDRILLAGHYRGAPASNGIQLPPTDTAAAAPYHPWAAGFDQKDGRGQWAVDGAGGGPSGALAHQIHPAPSGAILTVMSASDTVRVGNLLVAAQPGNFNNKLLMARITQQYNTLTGVAYLDANVNGQQDASEGGFPGGLVVEVNPGNLPCAAPETTGRYNAYVDLAAYSASLPYPPAHYTVVTQGPAATSFSTYGNVGAGRSFALQPIPNQPDVQVVLTHISPARPGFPVVYDVLYRNVGTVALAAGTVTLTHDARLTFTSASVAPATTAGPTLGWTYVNLLPGETRRVRVICGLPPTAPLGDTITSQATAPLTGDLAPTDNVATARRIVTGSFDPNDIEVSPVALTTTQVAVGEWLEYTIRFQNHGTDTAFTVAVNDSLPASLLQLSSFRFLAASHTCGWGISPTGQVLVTFPSIHLPPQTTNLIESDGFIRFKVRAASTLVAGDEIPNQARIHFDYNFPLETNTALTTIQSALGASAGAVSQSAGVTLWPNPTSNRLHVEVVRAPGSPLVLTLLDALGRPVRTQTVAVTTQGLSRTTFDVGGLPVGVYVLRGQGAGEPFTRRVVVR